MKKFFSIVLVFSLIYMFIVPVQAQANIECSYTTDGYRVNITGRVLNVNTPHMVTLMVGEIENLVYIDQTTSTSSGEFEFNFSVPETLPEGNYSFKINHQNSDTPYTGVLNYKYIERTITREFVNSDIIVNVNGYIPTIQGTLSCIEGKSATISIINTTNNTVIAEDTVTSDDGVYNLNYTLPSLLLGKKYSITISCLEGNSTLVYVNAIIDSAVILVTVSGEIQVADNVRLDAQLQSANIESLNKNTSVTANRAISATIPNLVAYMSCNLSLQGYETIENPELNPVPDENEEVQIVSTYNATGEINSLFYLVVNIKDIPYLSDYIFTMEYEPTKTELVDACAFTQELETTSGVIQGTNIEILSAESGKITFRINEELPSNKVSSGVVNLLKFKKLVSEDVSITSKIERNVESVE